MDTARASTLLRTGLEDRQVRLGELLEDRGGHGGVAQVGGDAHSRIRPAIPSRRKFSMVRAVAMAARGHTG